MKLSKHISLTTIYGTGVTKKKPDTVDPLGGYLVSVVSLNQGYGKWDGSHAKYLRV